MCVLVDQGDDVDVSILTNLLESRIRMGKLLELESKPLQFLEIRVSVFFTFQGRDQFCLEGLKQKPSVCPRLSRFARIRAVWPCATRTATRRCKAILPDIFLQSFTYVSSRSCTAGWP